VPRDGNLLRLALSRCRRSLSFTALFSFVSNSLLLTVSLYTIQLYDRVLTTRSTDTLLYLTLIALLALAAMSFIEIARTRLLIEVSSFIDEQLAPEAFRRSLGNSLQGRSYRSEVVRDLTELRMFVTGAGILAIFDLPWAPLFLAIIVMLNPLLGLVSALSMVVLFLLAFINDRVSSARLKQSNVLGFRVMQELEANIRNAEIIDALGMLPAVATRWLAHNREALRLQAMASVSGGTILGITKFCRLAVQVLILAVGAWLVLRQELTGGAMIAASIMLGRALAPIDYIISVWKQLVGARAAYRRLDQCFAEPPLRPAGLPLPPPRGTLTVEEVRFTSALTGRDILSDITFDVDAGETLAIVGPSAAGKSTLVRLIVGIAQPTKGYVRLDGAEVFPWNRDDLGPHVGYLPQEVPLFNATVAENIARLRDLDADAVVEAAQKANVHDMILRLPRGYDTEIGDSGVRLSGGQRQRVGLARALYGRPSVVVLDEPNANLDSEGDAALVRAINELKAQNTTIVFVTHRPGLIAYADKLLLLRGGVAELFGPRQEIMERMKLHSFVPNAAQQLSRSDNLVFKRRRAR